MNSPYTGRFYITQGFTLTKHDGLDLVGQDSKDIHSTVNGTVHYAGYENPANYKQGFGLYVCIQSDSDGCFYYYGHLSTCKVKTGDRVKITDVIGVEGSSGYSTGKHCHYEIRKTFMKDSPNNVVDVCKVSGIPNTPGAVYDDGYRPNSTGVENGVEKKHIKVIVNDKTVFEGDV